MESDFPAGRYGGGCYASAVILSNLPCVPIPVGVVVAFVVAEVAFDEVRRSARAASGFALRSPRIVRLRPDLAPDQAATLSSLESRCEINAAAGE